MKSCKHTEIYVFGTGPIYSNSQDTIFGISIRKFWIKKASTRKQFSTAAICSISNYLLHRLKKKAKKSYMLVITLKKYLSKWIIL